MNKDELKAYKGEKQIYLLTSDLDKYVIAKDGYHISSDTVFITGKKIELNGEASNFKGKIPMSQIEDIRTKGISVGTALTVTWLSIVTVLAVLAMAGSGML